MLWKSDTHAHSGWFTPCFHLFPIKETHRSSCNIPQMFDIHIYARYVPVKIYNLTHQLSATKHRRLLSASIKHENSAVRQEDCVLSWWHNAAWRVFTSQFGVSCSNSSSDGSSRSCCGKSCRQWVSLCGSDNINFNLAGMRMCVAAVFGNMHRTSVTIGESCCRLCWGEWVSRWVCN